MRSGKGGQKGTDTYAEHVKTHRAKAHFSGRLDLVYSPSTSMYFEGTNIQDCQLGLPWM
jgi:hypothetical protein